LKPALSIRMLRDSTPVFCRHDVIGAWRIVIKSAREFARRSPE
jgi:hypothetical protein